jgi:3(or 17)beta-hydroxysteroid dehydrogenase
MKRMDGRVALVTGAAMGIGRACAELLAAEGAAVVVTDREAALGTAVVDAIRSAGGRAVFVAHDVTNETQWIRAVDEARRAFGKLDVLVNNAGVGRAGDVEHETLQAWRDLLAINLDGVFLGIKHAIPAMREAGGGSIINLSSIEGLVGDPSLAAYNASKGGVRLLTKSAALYCAKGGTKIRVNSVHPGYIWTPMVQQFTEAYYRAAVSGGVDSWNLRDKHMASTLLRLTSHLSREGETARVVVWAHNSHLGDDAWTELGARGELNVGQLLREQYPHDSVLVGFTTHTGTVTAASDWDSPAERKRVRPALEGSYERLFHDAELHDSLFIFHHQHDLAWTLDEPRLERAIGVIYRPETERASHYFNASLSRQFDAVLHYDVTRAVEPLERSAQWNRGELPETFPSAL